MFTEPGVFIDAFKTFIFITSWLYNSSFQHLQKINCSPAEFEGTDAKSGK